MPYVDRIGSCGLDPTPACATVAHTHTHTFSLRHRITARVLQRDCDSDQNSRDGLAEGRRKDAEGARLPRQLTKQSLKTMKCRRLTGQPNLPHYFRFRPQVLGLDAAADSAVRLMPQWSASASCWRARHATWQFFPGNPSPLPPCPLPRPPRNGAPESTRMLSAE